MAIEDLPTPLSPKRTILASINSEFPFFLVVLGVPFCFRFSLGSYFVYIIFFTFNSILGNNYCMSLNFVMDFFVMHHPSRNYTYLLLVYSSMLPYYFSYQLSSPHLAVSTSLYHSLLFQPFQGIL